MYSCQSLKKVNLLIKERGENPTRKVPRDVIQYPRVSPSVFKYYNAFPAELHD